MYAHVKMTQNYVLFLQKLKDLERLIPTATIENAIKTTVKYIKKKARIEQNFRKAERIDKLDRIGYTSPSESSV